MMHSNRRAVAAAVLCFVASLALVSGVSALQVTEKSTVEQLVQALYQSQEETIAATATIAASEPSFLELAETGAHAKCSDGTLCPIKGGQCCGTGRMCCPASHPCQPTNPPSCGTHSMTKALALAKAKALEEVVKTKEHEEHVKSTSESGIKEAAEEKLKKEAKHNLEQSAKQSEQKTKSNMAKHEESLKQHATEAEERSKKQRKHDEEQAKKDEGENKQRKEKARLERRSKRRAEKHAKRMQERAQKRNEQNSKREFHKKEQEQKQKQREAEKEFADKQKALKEAAAKAKELLQWQHGWRNYGHGYAPGRVSRLGPICLMSGLGRRGGYHGLLAQLPSSCRPRGRVLLDVHSASGWTQRLDVLRNGQVHWIAGRTGASWIPLDGLSFVRADQNQVRLSLGRHWAHIGGSWARPTVTYWNSYCQVQGLIRTNTWGARAVARVPSRCRPRDGRLIFNVNHHIDTIRLDLLPNGVLYWVNKQGGHSFPWNWLSLSSLGWFNRSPARIRLFNGWRPYSHGYRKPSYRKQGSMCVLSGLLRGNRWGSWMGRLPGHCRPATGRLIFMVNNHGGRYRAARIDVMRNGYFRWSGGQRSHGWVSLDGIKFDTKK
eukprot:TRINITY_DN65862_c9_g1_i1.p2 TRINITY_DN65862_c9_g1~~TRINITY_DN65862_c9_g1_i1.p2  ORF type:complete len:624 (-),score=307.06 TRINITY_DN65862_c9_g1_i1:137-1954(-)